MLLLLAETQGYRDRDVLCICPIELQRHPEHAQDRCAASGKPCRCRLVPVCARALGGAVPGSVEGTFGSAVAVHSLCPPPGRKTGVGQKLRHCTPAGAVCYVKRGIGHSSCLFHNILMDSLCCPPSDDCVPAAAGAERRCTG